MFSEIPSQMVMISCWVIGIPMLICFIDLFIFGPMRRKQLDSDPNGIRLCGRPSDYQSSIFWFIFFEVLCIVAVMFVASIFVGDMYVYKIIETGQLPPAFFEDLYNSHGGFGFLLAIAVFGLCIWPHFIINSLYATLYITEECFDIRSISLIKPMYINWNIVYSVKIYNDTASQSGIKQVVIVYLMPDKPISRTNRPSNLTINGKHPQIHEIVDRLKLYAPEKISYL